MRLIFVYNADSGFFNAVSDWAHKMFSPETYACKLCALTYSHAGMRREWRAFINRLGYPLEFLHRDELRAKHGIGDVPLPAVFKKTGDTVDVWLSAAEMSRVATLSELQQLIVGRLALTSDE